ncbi:MAG: DUF1844 domain-containing protein [Candidatus Marinimicrobia bacterium]|nr:DUF1844 domain-containing protein [Candidatus Neomarinimicrobiota bacterium]MCF7839857.1 DUF1844 domain-containing protein [Candidatus Neomarinimicrobiota bacterium]
MTEQKLSKDELFMLLVNQLSSSAWIQLGKIPDPMSGKVERNLEAASLTIDIIDAMADKSKGNLDKESEQFLSATLSQLKMNYLDEKKKPDPPKDEKSDKKETAGNDKPEKEETKEE